jgi:hypothetical protein
MGAELGIGSIDTALADALRPIALLAARVVPAGVGAAVDIVGPTPNGSLVTVATHERLVDIHAAAFAFGEGPAPSVRRTREVVIDELPSALGGRWDLLATDAGLHSALSHPLVDDGKAGPELVGILTIYGAHRPSVRAADLQAVSLLAIVATATIVGHRDPDRLREIPLPSLDQLVLDIGLPTIDLRHVERDHQASA